MTCAIIRHRIGRNLRLGKTELSQVIHIHDQEVAVGIRTRPFLLQRSPIGFLLLLWYVTTKFSSLKQRELIIWQFWRPGVQNTLYWDKIQVSVVTFIPEALGKLCSSEVSSPWRPPAILGSWLLQSRQRCISESWSASLTLALSVSLSDSASIVNLSISDLGLCRSPKITGINIQILIHIYYVY